MAGLGSRGSWAGLAVAAVLLAASGPGSAVGAASRAAPPSLKAKPPPPPGFIELAAVSNGCGGGVASSDPRYGDTSSYRDSITPGDIYTVNFREACNLHDAGYSGALVWDPFEGRYIDFSEPQWTQEKIDEKFLRDMRTLCDRQIPAGKDNALEACKGLNGTQGVSAYGRYLFVRASGGLFYKERVHLAGQWANTAPGWPVCDIGAHPWTITQDKRTVTAKWRHGGTGNQIGHFTGTLTTRDQDSVVKGTFTIMDGGSKVAGGDMSWTVTSADKFDFNGTAVPGGTMKRKTRSTQGVGVASAPPRCKYVKPPPAKPKPPPTQASSFTLVSSLTEVKNPNAPELTIDAAGGKATWDHTGPFGGAGKGGEWKVEYTFNVPQTLTPGKSSSVTVGLAASNVQPEQPLFIQMTVRAPDFAQALSINYPNPAQASKTFTIPISAGLKDAKELFVVIGVVSAEVIYHYRRSG